MIRARMKETKKSGTLDDPCVSAYSIFHIGDFFAYKMISCPGQYYLDNQKELGSSLSLAILLFLVL